MHLNYQQEECKRVLCREPRGQRPRDNRKGWVQGTESSLWPNRGYGTFRETQRPHYSEPNNLY